jgi:hypothetical protein
VFTCEFTWRFFPRTVDTNLVREFGPVSEVPRVLFAWVNLTAACSTLSPGRSMSGMLIPLNHSVLLVCSVHFSECQQTEEPPRPALASAARSFLLLFLLLLLRPLGTAVKTHLARNACLDLAYLVRHTLPPDTFAGAHWGVL